MILLDSATPGTTQDINAEENAAIHNVVTGLTNPNIHKCILRLFVTWDGTSRTRNLSVQIKDTGGEVYHEDFVQAVTHYASSDKTIFLVPILYDESNGLTIKVWSDNANDDNETVGYEMYSDDAEYFEDFRAAAGSPTANSRTERIKTTDDNVTTLIGRVTAALFSGITSLAEWLGAMAGSHTADTTALGEINATGPGTGSGTFDEAADSQEAIANGAAGGGATAQQVWEYGTRVLTAGTNIGTVTANIIQIDGLTTVDQSAVLKLKQLDVTNSAGTAVIMSGTGIGANGLSLVGGTAGAGLLATGGASSNAIRLAGTGAGSTVLISSAETDVPSIEIVSSDSSAINISGTTFGIDVDASAGSGVRIVGTVSGVAITGGTTGIGVDIDGGSSSGAGVKINTVSGIALDITAASGIGIDVSSGDSYGIRVASIGASGILVEGTLFGFEITASAGSALSAISTGGNGDGIVATGNGSGADIRGDITGNLSGSVGTVAADGVSASSLKADAVTEIADGVLLRSISVNDVEDTAGEHSLCGIILAIMESSRAGTTWTIRQTGDSSGGAGTFATKTLTVDAAATPVTGVT